MIVMSRRHGFCVHDRHEGRARACVAGALGLCDRL